MAGLLLERGADVNWIAKNGLTSLHLTAQEDAVPVATILVKNGAQIDPKTKVVLQQQQQQQDNVYTNTVSVHWSVVV